MPPRTPPPEAFPGEGHPGDSAARYRVLLEHVPEAIVVLDVETGRFVDMNRHAPELFRLSREELLKVGPADMSPRFQPDGRTSSEAAQGYVTQALAGETVAFEWAHRGGDGRDFPAEVRLVRLPSQSHPLVCGTITDISERKLAEKTLIESERRLRRAQKMEAIGQLASGVAHDFNNLLTVIIGYAELGKTQLDPAHPVFDALGQIEQAAHQAEGVTRALLTSSRREQGERRPILLEEVLSRSIALVERTLPASITLVADTRGARGRWVDGDPDQLGQVVMNLAINARDSMSDGGQLSIQLRVEEGPGSAPGAPPAEQVLLVVSDTGVGIPPELQFRVFEPYFTTKPRGKGTGLGLSITQGIVESHGGTIDLHSALGGGTTFTVRLPTIGGPQAAPRPPGLAAPRVVRGGTVLVAEDDPLVAELLRHTLAAMGLEVVLTDNGSEALDRFLESPRRFDCLVLDHDLPGATGGDCARRIRARHYDIPILIVTGAHDGPLDPGLVGVELLRKPFPLDRLRGAVGALLPDPSHPDAHPDPHPGGGTSADP